ncbi:Hsp20/alpha crystallin family protein [Frankia sp. AiPs1]|uniref:Hsp20/alpha crystallin family protein n=1 Tax=Frankia sp. AiPs1 TaxID=573493 RepID=UPI0020441331|nr:Hsp20/alpha crystallin family protein [Frankia sp. AiPs1]MCM3925722.1 Hsp20/alpha crystallin family protein [Frankia sp. AiPs1]
MALSTRGTPDSGATLGRWDPFREIEEAWSRMGSLLGDVAGGSGRPLGVLAGAVLPVDIEETDDVYVVELELPGVRRGDVSIDLRDDELHVTGEICERERTGIVRRRSRRVGRFEHRIALPGEVDVEGVTANLADGVLTVTLPKARHSRPRHIEITVSDRGEVEAGRESGAAARETGSAGRETGAADRETRAAGREAGSPGREAGFAGRVFR